MQSHLKNRADTGELENSKIVGEMTGSIVNASSSSSSSNGGIVLAFQHFIPPSFSVWEVRVSKSFSLIAKVGHFPMARMWGRVEPMHLRLTEANIEAAEDGEGPKK